MTEPLEEGPGNPDTGESRAEPAGRFVLRGDQGTDTAQVWLSAFLIVAAAVMAYSNGVGIPFQGEDQTAIRDNTPLHSVATFPSAMGKESPHALVYFTYALNWALAPALATPFHVVNILLHIVNGILVFLLCRRLLGASSNPVIAMLAGMLFVLHPLNTESVNYIVGRPALLGSCLALSSLYLFTRAVEGNECRAGGLSASVVFFVLAGCAADLALLVPALVLIIDWIRGGSALRKRWLVHVPYWGLLAALVAARWAAGYGPSLSFPTSETVARFARLSIWPTGLCVVPNVSDGSGTIGLIVMLGLLAAALLLTAARSVAGLGLLWFLLGLAYLPDKADAERRAYFALLGLVLIVPYLFTFLRQQPLRVAGGLLAAALLFAAGAGVHLRNSAWQDEMSLWSDALNKVPESAEAAHCLGRAYLVTASVAPIPDIARRAAQEAELYLRQALEGDPGSTRIAHDLGVALSRQGKMDDAAEQFLAVLRRDIRNRPAMIELALIYLEKGRADRVFLAKAFEYFGAANALEPLSGDALGRYGIALFESGDFGAAATALKGAVGGSDSSPFGPALRQAQEAVKRFEALEQQAAALLSKNPADPNALKIQAQILLTRGQALQAGYLLDQLRRDGLEDFGVWLLTGCVRAKMNATGRFVQEWPGAPERPANVKSAWLELARMCANLGLWEAAREYLESMPAQTEIETPALLSLAGLALELRQPQMARDFLTKATDAYPNDPAPWMRLAELAAAGNDSASAWKYVAEAEKRGADPAQVAALKGRLGGGETGQGTRTVIR